MHQISLWETDNKYPNGKSVFNDPNFASNKSRPIHRWVPWIAGFASEFVKGVLDANLNKPSVVLDPFSGVGTTLVEANLAGHDVIGFEINPYAALACRVKLSAPNINVAELKKYLVRLRDFYASASSTDYSPQSHPPAGFKTRVPFFSPLILSKVLIIRDFIASIEDPRISDLFQVAFGATMVGYSNYSYEPSLGTRRAVGKPDRDDFPVFDAFLTKLEDMAADLQSLRAETGASLSRPSWRVINSSFFDYANHIEAQSVDLCITSPPYLNNYHYIRNTRPQLYWLGFVEKPDDTQCLEQANFGKYWQAVRELPSVDFAFPDPPSALVQQIETLRSLHSDKGVYGGGGWANYAVSYFNDCFRFTSGLKHSLRRGGAAYVVIGNSIIQGLMLPTDRYLAEIAEQLGLRVASIETPRPTRVGNSIIKSDVRVEKAETQHQLYEAVVHLTRP